MKQYIDIVKDCLSTMIVVREKYRAAKNITYSPSDNFQNRIFHIYSVETPALLVEMLKKLKLIEQDETEEGIYVSNVFFYFSRLENEAKIWEAFYDNFECQNVAPCIEKLIALTGETEQCFEKLKLVA